MTHRETTHAFLEGEFEALEPFGFVAIGPIGHPLHVIEVMRREDSALEVRVPGRPSFAPSLAPEVEKSLVELGFQRAEEADPRLPFTADAADPAAALAKVLSALSDAFGEDPDVPLDVVHGSHRDEHEARLKLAEVRKNVERVISELTETAIAQDADGDYVLPIGDVQVCVAPRVLHGGPAIVRIFSVTNVGVTVGPELGLLLARLNFGLMFGRFALDAEHNAIWFDETLLGDQLNEEALRFAIHVVSKTSDEWDDRLKQMFGGATYQEMLRLRGGLEEMPSKPGGSQDAGVGLYL